MSTGGWILSVLWTLIIIALVVAGIAWLMSAVARREASAGPGGEAGPSAREILDRRLASGELTLEEYRQLRKAIGSAPDQASSSRSGPHHGAPTAPSAA